MPFETVMRNLAGLHHSSIAVDFGKPIRFAEGKGVLIPAEGENDGFQALRAAVLNGGVEKPRRHEAHITLLHPRNATCSDSIFRQIEQTEFPGKIIFQTISLIEQVAGGPWRVLRTVDLYGLDDAGA